RMLDAACRSVTAAMCSTRGATPTRARAVSCSPIQRSSGCTWARSAPDAPPDPQGAPSSRRDGAPFRGRVTRMWTAHAKGPRSEGRGPSVACVDLAHVQEVVVVVVAVLEDTDRGEGRVADLVELDRARDTVVVGNAARNDDVGAFCVAGAGGAV